MMWPGAARRARRCWWKNGRKVWGIRFRSEGAAQKSALFALPLFRKPAFPGFFHIVQIGDQEVLDFLHSLRRNGQGAYLGGFMTLTVPAELGDEDLQGSLASLTHDANAATQESSKGLRKDTGVIDSAAELEKIGTLLQVVSLASHPNLPGGQIVVLPTARIRNVSSLSRTSPGTPLCAIYTETLPDVEVPHDDNIRAVHLEIIASMKDMLTTSFMYKDQFEQVVKYYSLDDPLKLADLVAGMSSAASREELQNVLTEASALKRLQKVLLLIKKDLEQGRLQHKVAHSVEKSFENDNHKYMLQQQLKEIKKELCLDQDSTEQIVRSFMEAIEKLHEVPGEAHKAMLAELSRLQQMDQSSPEFNISRTYLDWIVSLPWGNATEDNTDIASAERILHEDHHGLNDVKERILEFMAVGVLKQSIGGKILCLVGPPGVGKTSVGRSVARALGRQFFRFTVGGLQDVAEINGHRRTYVGALPGKIIQALKVTQSSNPVILIDEVDKLGRGGVRGDPSSILLEVLDPSQNSSFRDLYLDVPVDLSRVLFLCTANDPNQIPAPLLDRMETISIAGYIFDEKRVIAQNYIIPKLAQNLGVTKDHLQFCDSAIQKLCEDYAREAGIRDLRMLIEKVARKVALSVVRAGMVLKQPVHVNAQSLHEYVGQPTFHSDQMFEGSMPSGVARALAWSPHGGVIIMVEVQLRRRKRSTTALHLSGSLGSVMRESCQIALTFAQLLLKQLDAQNNVLNEASLHMHVPLGAQPKDGPSAGIAMTTAVLSLALGRSVSPGLAMAGEMTLTGKVLRVTGIKEKVLTARRENVEVVILPMLNQADFLEVEPRVRAGLTVHFVDHFADVYRLAFGAASPAVVLSLEVQSVPPITHRCFNPP